MLKRKFSTINRNRNHYSHACTCCTPRPMGKYFAKKHFNKELNKEELLDRLYDEGMMVSSDNVYIVPTYLYKNEFGDIDDLMEYLGIENWRYDDGYTLCDDCGKAVNLYNNNYSEGTVVNNEFLCEDCISDSYHASDYIEQLINNPKEANQFLSDETLEEYGFKKIDENFRSDEYTHDDPKELLKKYAKNGCEVIFNITSRDPYRVGYEVWVRCPEEEDGEDEDLY